MRLWSFLFRDRTVPPPDPLPAVRLAYAYACLDCGWVLEHADNLRCRKCGSAAIFPVLSVLNQTRNRALQRLKMQETIKAAKQKGARNDVAFLTAPEPPPDAA